MAAIALVPRLQERGYRLERHGLVPERSKASSVDTLATATYGLHAARQSSPWVTLRTRLPAFEPAELRDLLTAERRLIKVRCMRQTLHILPLELARTAHHATLRQRLAPCRARLRQLGRSERALRDACAHVRGAIGDTPVPHRELEVGASASRRQLSLIRTAIKWLWETGEIAHVDLSPSLHHEHRAFVLTATHYPGLDLRAEAPDLESSCDALVRQHIRAFGPVSITDTAWWSGLGQAAVKGAVTRAGAEFVQVAIDGVSDELLMAADKLDRLRNTEPLDPAHVTLLAYEDPTLKGYFATRHRYVEPRNYNLLFNTIGEARAAIMVGGEAVGVWTFDRRARRVTHALMQKLAKSVRDTIAERLLDMEDFLRAEPMHT